LVRDNELTLSFNEHGVSTKEVVLLLFPFNN
jgi:hypothetical protein